MKFRWKLIVALLALNLMPALHAQAGTEQITVVNHIDIKPDYALPHASERSAAIFHAEQAATKQDAGLVSYSLLQEVDSPNHFTLIETWRDRKAYEMHLGSAHTVRFRTDLQPLLGSPFDSRSHHLFP